MNNRLTLMVAAAAVIGAAAYYFSQQQETNAGMVPEDTSGTSEGAPLAEVKVPEQLSAAAQIGERIFNAKCAVCHNRNAAGQNGVAPALIHQIYRPGHHGDVAFLLAAKNGVRAHHWRFGNMPPVEGLTDADVKSIVAYIRELQQFNGIN